MAEIHGNLDGVRKSLLEELETLYDYEINRDEFLPGELALAMGSMSARMNRELSVYIARSGRVMDVTIGTVDNVQLADLRLRRNQARLSGVRCIHTHPGGSAALSDVDLSALKTLMLDAMCALGVDADGRITGVAVAFHGLPEMGDDQPELLPHVALEDIPQEAWIARMLESDVIRPDPQLNTKPEQERALIVGLDSVEKLDELQSLCESAGLAVVGRSAQSKSRPDPATYVGSGKAQELALDAQALEADTVVMDDELNTTQQSNLETVIGLKVLDRTTLILEIFAQRANTREGKLQVELAQLNYRASHLIGKGMVLSRVTSGVGTRTRGPGESRLEMDRRYIRGRINTLNGELEELEKQRALRRRTRERAAVPVVALVGYTNAGKSSLMNRLSGSDVFVEDRLFATLDAISRRMVLPDGGEFVLVDSVGFISKLPTELIEAFHATLEEAVLADLLVLVHDASNPEWQAQRAVVEKVLADLGADVQPRIEALNKWDLANEENAPHLPGAVRTSAVTGEGLDELLVMIGDALRTQESTAQVLIPFSSYSALNELRQTGRLSDEEHLDTGTRVTVTGSMPAIQKVLAKYNLQATKESFC